MNSNLSSVGEWKIKYGKFAGTKFSDLVRDEPDYAKWVANIDRNMKVRLYLKLTLGLP